MKHILNLTLTFINFLIFFCSAWVISTLSSSSCIHSTILSNFLLNPSSAFFNLLLHSNEVTVYRATNRIHVLEYIFNR